MKYCVACGAKNKNKEEQCIACGSYEFEYHCPQCGTVFHNPNRCPNCGLRAGAVKRFCPKCGNVVFSAECPQCGYVNEAIRKRSSSIDMDAIKQGLNTTGAKMESAVKSGMQKSGSLLKRAGELLEESGSKSSRIHTENKKADSGFRSDEFWADDEESHPRTYRNRRSKKFNIKKIGAVAAALIAVVLLCVLIFSKSGPEATAVKFMNGLKTLNFSQMATCLYDAEAVSYYEQLGDTAKETKDDLTKAVLDIVKKNAKTVKIKTSKITEEDGLALVSATCSCKDISDAVENAYSMVINNSMESFFDTGSHSDRKELARIFKKAYQDYLSDNPARTTRITGTIKLSKLENKWFVEEADMDISPIVPNTLISMLNTY